MNTVQSSKIVTIAWRDSIWFADIDDTLINTSSVSPASSEGIRIVFEPYCGPKKAREVQSNFNVLWDLMIDGYRVAHEDDWKTVQGGEQAFDELVAYFANSQREVQATYGHIKKWSREIFIKLAAERTGITVSPELVHEAANAYWMTLMEHVSIFSDAKKLTDKIFAHHRPLYLVTSSDGRLMMQPDGQFVYDPPYSEGLKRERVERLRNKGLNFNLISIGDPEDKPHRDFFNKALRMAREDLGRSFDHNNAIMLGDSFAGDLQTPKEQLGFGLTVLRDENQAGMIVKDEHQVITNDLGDVIRYLT